MIHQLRRFLSDRCGVAAIEAALILPIVLLVIAGTIEYSRVLLAQHMIRDIVDEAARTAVVTGQSTLTVENSVDEAVDEVPGVSSFVVDVTSTSTFDITVSGTFELFFGDLLPTNVVEFSITAQYPL